MPALTRGSADFFDPFRQQARGMGKAVLCTGQAPEPRPFKDWDAERNRSQTGHEKYHKRLEKIADNAGAQDTVAREAHQPT